jgi:hypothetical protein
MIEYYDYSGEGHVGAKLDEKGVSVGAGGGGRRVSKRVFRFKGRIPQDFPRPAEEKKETNAESRSGRYKATASTPPVSLMRRCLMRRITLVRILLGSAITIPVLLFLILIWKEQVHRRWYNAVEDRIVRLADKRPDGVTPEQWAACLHWTWQLHTNWGPSYGFRASARDGFLAEFDRRLDGKVDLGTIDWIWDQYCLNSTGGAGYSKRYRPTTPVRMKIAAKNAFKENNLNDWLQMLERLREQN